MNSAHISYTQRSSDATPEGEVAALANVYRFILDSHAKKEATRPGGPDDAKGSKHDRARPIIQESS
jgi:hypothetical protein